MKPAFLEEKDIIGAAVKRTVERIDTLQRGQTIAWSELESLSGFERYSQHWSTYLRRVRRDVLKSKRGIKLAAVVSVGLKLMTEAEQVNDLSRQLRARRQLNRGIKELRAVPDASLASHERATKHRKIELARTARRGADYALRVGHQLAKPSANGVPRVKQQRQKTAA